MSTMCTCEEIKQETLARAHRASKLGTVERWWTQDEKLKITIHDPPPRVRKTDTFVVFCLFVFHSVTCLKTCHFNAIMRNFGFFLEIIKTNNVYQ